MTWLLLLALVPVLEIAHGLFGPEARNRRRWKREAELKRIYGRFDR